MLSRGGIKHGLSLISAELQTISSANVTADSREWIILAFKFVSSNTTRTIPDQTELISSTPSFYIKQGAVLALHAGSILNRSERLTIYVFFFVWSQQKIIDPYLLRNGILPRELHNLILLFWFFWQPTNTNSFYLHHPKTAIAFQMISKFPF